jgi:hypothetical protein
MQFSLPLVYPPKPGLVKKRIGFVFKKLQKRQNGGVMLHPVKTYSVFLL